MLKMVRLKVLIVMTAKLMVLLTKSTMVLPLARSMTLRAKKAETPLDIVLLFEYIHPEIH